MAERLRNATSLRGMASPLNCSVNGLCCAVGRNCEGGSSPKRADSP